MAYPDDTNLGDMDESKPVGATEQVSALDNASRETRRCVKNTVGVGHDLTTGEHSAGEIATTFIGTHAEILAIVTPVKGATAIATDLGGVPYYYDGANWVVDVGSDVQSHRTKSPLDHPPLSVTGEKIANNSITASKLKDLAIASPKISEVGVDLSRITDKSIDFNKLNDVSKSYPSPITQRFGGSGVLGDVEINAPVMWAHTDGVVVRQYKNLTITNTVTVTTNAGTKLVIIACQGTFQIDAGSLLALVGTAALGGSPGAPGLIGEHGYGSHGISISPTSFGGSGGGGGGGISAAPPGIDAGGAGGSASNLGGDAGASPAPGNDGGAGVAIDAFKAWVGRNTLKNGALLFGYGAGGGGGFQDTTGGWGGKGSPSLYIEADEIIITAGAGVSCNGQDGYPGVTLGAGGGGGGAGCISLLCRTATIGTAPVVLGGAGGLGTGTHGDGGVGEDGIYTLVQIDQHASAQIAPADVIHLQLTIPIPTAGLG